MNSSAIRSYAASLSYCIVSSDWLPTLSCLNCRGLLDVHQPDQNEPRRLLATCPGCGRWYRMTVSNKENELIMLELPDVEQVLEAPPSSEVRPA